MPAQATLSANCRPYRCTDTALFTQDRTNQIRGLTSIELDNFEKAGWIGPYSLLSPEGTTSICNIADRISDQFVRQGLQVHAHRLNAFKTRPWFKSIHAYERVFCEVAAHPTIVERVASLLGPDVILWGVATIVRQPGQLHRWHVDVEHRRWPGVTAFIALKNISHQSALKVIKRSHRIAAVPQELGVTTDAEVVVASQHWEPQSELEIIDMKDGDFIIFAGRLWHGSHNRTDKVRIALTAQYCRPDAKVQIPLNWDEPIDWHSESPPCILVSGQDRFHVNKLVQWP